MSEVGSTTALANADETSTNEPPRKYPRRNYDTSVGVTTRARQREQEKMTEENEPSITVSNGLSESNTLNDSSAIEKCAICMEAFTEQEIGMPENCEHSFCWSCIDEWAKKNNSCPIDRITFRRIYVKHSYTSPNSYKTVPVKDNRLQIELEDNFLEMIDDDLSCRVCGEDDQEDLLLICDECGNGYHTFCLELPGIPDTPEWMCPLCQVDQVSANEDLYEDSDLDELQQILFDDTFDTTETDIELADIVAPIRRARVRPTVRTRRGTVRNQRTTRTRTARISGRRQRQTRQRRPRAARRQLTSVAQQRQRQRHERQVQDNVHRRIENLNTQNGERITGSTTGNERPRLSVFNSEPIAFDDEPSSVTASSSSSSSRSVITPSEAARRIAASGIPIVRNRTEPSISRELSLHRTMPLLDRVPSRTIRPPLIVPSIQQRIPVSQLPRIQRRTEPRLTPSNTPSSANDNFHRSQERFHDSQHA